MEFENVIATKSESIEMQSAAANNSKAIEAGYGGEQEESRSTSGSPLLGAEAPSARPDSLPPITTPPPRPANPPPRTSRTALASIPGNPAAPSSPVITRQPTPLNFSVAKMDVVSLLFYTGAITTHKSHVRLERSVRTAGDQIASEVSTTNAQLKDSISYDELLHTLAHENERIMTKDWRLLYSRAVFYDCERPGGGVFNAVTDMPVISSLPPGAAILTDKRLLLLSSQCDSGIKFTSIGVEKQKNKSSVYQLTAYSSDNIHYKPLPLNNFQSIELRAATGARSHAHIRAEKACCCGLCCCFGSCCPPAIKQWPFSLVRPVEAFNERTLMIGLLLPPWKNKCMLHLELDVSMPLSCARDFVAMLQVHQQLES